MHLFHFSLLFVAAVQNTNSVTLDGESLEKLKHAYNNIVPTERRIRDFDKVDVESDDEGVFIYSTVNATIVTEMGHRNNIVFNSAELAAGGFKRELALRSGVFDTEYSVLTDVLPKMKNLSLEYGDTSESLFPDLLLAENESHWIQLYYQRGSWEKGSSRHVRNSDEIALVFRSLAKWHAMGAVLIERGFNVGALNESITMRNKNRTLPFYRALLENFVELIRTRWGEEWRTEADQLSTLAPSLDYLITNIYQVTDGSFRVFNFGDMFLQSMIFCVGISDTLNTSSPIAVKFTHFPTVFVGSPSLDVNRLLFTLPSVKTALQHRKRLLDEEYYPSLISNLNRFGYLGAIPSYVEFRKELKRTRLIAVLDSINFFNNYVFEEDDPARPNVLDLVEDSWKTGIMRINFTGMLKNEFSDIMMSITEISSVEF